MEKDVSWIATVRLTRLGYGLTFERTGAYTIEEDGLSPEAFRTRLAECMETAMRFAPTSLRGGDR